MSFGFGIGDIIACVDLARKTIDALRTAGPDFEALRLELSSLHGVLEALEAEAAGPAPLLASAPPRRQAQLRALLANCRAGMADLQRLVRRYAAAGPGPRAGLARWVRLAAQDRRGPREKLAVHTASINMFLAALGHESLARLEFLLKNGRRAADRAGGGAAPHALGLAVAGGEEGGGAPAAGGGGGGVWQSIGGALADEGIADEQVDRFQEEVKAYVRYLVRGETPFWRQQEPLDLDPVLPPEGEGSEETAGTEHQEEELAAKKDTRRDGLRQRVRQMFVPLAPVPWSAQMAPGQPRPPMYMMPSKTTYTRMARKHLSIEALRSRAIEYELDALNPEYVIIKRWVPPEEQKDLWSLTRTIRDDRERVTTTLSVEDRGRHYSHYRHQAGDGLVLVRKTRRERSRSPGRAPLEYLAGGRPGETTPPPPPPPPFRDGVQAFDVAVTFEWSPRPSRRGASRDEAEEEDDAAGPPTPGGSRAPSQASRSSSPPRPRGSVSGDNPEEGRLDKGETRVPAHLVSRRAMMEMGFPSTEEGHVVVILAALKPAQILELLERSEEYAVGDPPGADANSPPRATGNVEDGIEDPCPFVEKEREQAEEEEEMVAGVPPPTQLQHPAVAGGRRRRGTWELKPHEDWHLTPGKMLYVAVRTPGGGGGGDAAGKPSSTVTSPTPSPAASSDPGDDDDDDDDDDSLRAYRQRAEAEERAWRAREEEEEEMLSLVEQWETLFDVDVKDGAKDDGSSEEAPLKVFDT